MYTDQLSVDKKKPTKKWRPTKTIVL